LRPRRRHFLYTGPLYAAAVGRRGGGGGTIVADAADAPNKEPKSNQTLSVRICTLIPAGPGPGSARLGQRSGALSRSGLAPAALGPAPSSIASAARTAA